MNTSLFTASASKSRLRQSSSGVQVSWGGGGGTGSRKPHTARHAHGPNGDQQHARRKGKWGRKQGKYPELRNKVLSMSVYSFLIELSNSLLCRCTSLLNARLHRSAVRAAAAQESSSSGCQVAQSLLRLTSAPRLV